MIDISQGAIYTDIVYGEGKELRPPNLGERASSVLFLHCSSHSKQLKQELIELKFQEKSLIQIDREQLEEWNSHLKRQKEGKRRGFTR